MSFRRTSLTPRMKPLSARKNAILSVLDVGTSKVVCLVARLDPVPESDTLRGRTHKAQIIGIGHQRSRGLKGGAIVDLEAAEQSIRLAVDAAERSGADPSHSLAWPGYPDRPEETDRSTPAGDDGVDR